MSTSADASRVTVLIVEDSSDHRLLMQRHLERAGIIVIAAATGEEALELLDGVDLVLLDQGLPRMSGLDTLRAIRDRLDGPSVVMVTGQGSTDLAVEAMREGAIDYVAKNPGYLDALPRIIDRAWRQHDLARRAAELQRLALLIHGAQDRDALIDRIVSGAHRLMRARAAALLEQAGDSLAVVGVVGEPGEELEAIQRRGTDSLPAAGETSVVGPADLVVALPAEDGEPYALLAVLGRAGSDPLDEELELAAAFASFAAVALRNLRRRELEAALIAELTQTIEARRDFVASVSHELRTPLTAISGFTETLLDKWSRFADEDRLELLEHVRTHARELRGIVEELIDVAGMERGLRRAVSPEPIDLRLAVDRSLGALGRQLEGRDVAVSVPDGIRVSADPELLERTLLNLLSNAAKFSDPGTPIAVSASGAGSDRLRITVRDEGIGLEPREAARVFDPFWRAPYSVANAVRGSGIGLSLVREYVRTMGGEVAVESTPGQGAAFSFTVPLA